MANPGGKVTGVTGVGVRVEILYPSHGYGGFDPSSNSVRNGVNG